MMIWNKLKEHADAEPGRIAVNWRENDVSYDELVHLVERAAASLPERSDPRPWRVIVQEADPFILLIKVLACWRCGCSAVVLRDSMSAEQVADILAWLKSAASYTGQYHQSDHAMVIPPPVMAGPRDEALVICTSGTTGKPKLVALPAESVWLNATTIASSLELTPGDRVAVNTPLGYMYGLMGGCMAALRAGATCYLFHPRDPLTQLQAAIRREGITVVQGPPSLFRLFMGYWNDDPFPSARMVTTGGEALDEGLVNDLSKAFPNAKRLFLYGMTEAGPRISHLPFEDGGGRAACIGLPYDHFAWRLDPVEQSPYRRLVLRGPSMFLGYINAAGQYEGLDADGFFHTNDLVEQDDRGFLHFRGRLDRIFRSGGKLINPVEIERLIASFPGVAEAFCRPERHNYLGLVPVVEVLAHEGILLNVDEIRSYSMSAMERHAVPRTITLAKGRRIAESGKRQVRPA